MGAILGTRGAVARRPRLTVVMAAASILVGALVALPGRQAEAAASTGNVDIQVSGPLADVMTEPSLSPRFSTSTHDYAVRCQAGANQVTLTFVGSGVITVGSESGTTVKVPVTVDENRAVVVTASSPSPSTEYWIRCLPHDFPVMEFERPVAPPEGWYVTGTFMAASDGSSKPYAMVLDNHGTPVWYQKTPAGSIDTRVLPGQTIAWAPNLGPSVGAFQNGGYNLYDLATQTARTVRTTTGPTDPHELLPLPNGNRMMIATPLLNGFDLSPLGARMDAANGTIVDCVIEEVNPQGEAVWVWRASDHIAVAESTQPALLTVNGQQAADIYHCNSVEVDPAVNPEVAEVLISLRHTDSLYLIDKVSRKISWKLGGNESTGADAAPRLRIAGGPAFTGQHDGRFQPRVDGRRRISLYDNRTFSSGPARGVEYDIDEDAATATQVWEYAAPDGRRAGATGSFRRYAKGSDNLIGWGLKNGTATPEIDGFTEVDEKGTVMFSMTYPKGDVEYRVVKEPPEALDVGLLRRTAGLVGAAPPPPNFVPLSPFRVWDSRSGPGPVGQIGPAGTRNVTLTGVGDVPATGVAAVVLNVTAVAPTAPTFVTAWPTGEARPNTSNLNVAAGDVRPNLVVVKVGDGGQVSFFNEAGRSDLVADVAGYYSDAGDQRYNPVSPSRLWDSRSGPGPVGRIPPGGTRDVTVTGVGDVPSTGVTAVVLNVTAVEPTARTFVTTWPTGEERPVASNLNVPPGDVRPNLVISKVNAAGQVSFYNDSGDTHLIADVAGYYTSSSGSGFNVLSPARVWDSRSGPGPRGEVGGAGARVTVTGVGNVPATGVTAVVLNVAAVAPTASTFITVWPAGEVRPEASNLNVPAGDVRSNLVVVKVGAGGEVELFNHAGRTHIVADVAGWY